MNPLSVGQLGQLHEVASGAQGVVYELPEFRMNGVPAMVYKAYKPDARKKIDVAALARMPEFAESLSPSDRVRLLSWAAWPWRLVEDGPGSVSGFLMPAIPPAFKTYMRKTGGSGWVTAGLQLLLEPAARLAKRGIVLTERQRYELIAETAKALAFLHSHDISVGDLSPRNLLFALNPPGVFFVDCDSMQIRGRSAMGTQVETPDWNVRTKSNPNEDLGTPASDSYKLGLLALRLLVGDQSTRDDTTLPAQTPGQIRQLVHDALSTNPAERPTPADWLDALASLTGSTPDIRKGPKGPKRRRALIVGAVAIAAIAGITIVAPDLDQSTKTGGNDTSNAVWNQISGAGGYHTVARIPVGQSASGVAAGIAVDPGNHTAYVTTYGENTVSVINTISRNVSATIPVGRSPDDVAVDPGTHTAYVTNYNDSTLSVIDTTSGAVTATIPVGKKPMRVALDPGTHTAYVTNGRLVSSGSDDTVSVIDTVSRTRTATISVGKNPGGVAVDPGSHIVYVANRADSTVSVIAPGSRTVTTTIPVARNPVGVAIDPSTHLVYVTTEGGANPANGDVVVIDTTGRGGDARIPVGKDPQHVTVDPEAHTVYVSNNEDNSLSVIDTTSRTVGTIPVGRDPLGVAVDAGTHTVYVTSPADANVSVITR